MKFIKFSLFVFAFLAFVTCNSRPKSIILTEQVALADTLLSFMQQERFEEITNRLDEHLKPQLNKEQLAVVWTQLTTKYGKLNKKELIENKQFNGNGSMVTYKCSFGTQKLNFVVVFGNHNKISGIFFKS